MENVLVVDANARLRGKRLTTLDVIGVGPRVTTSLLRYYGFEVELWPYERIVESPRLLNRYDVLAISFMVSDVHAVRKLIALWRRIRSRNRLIVLGGPGTLDDRVLGLLDFDIAFIGEIESTFHTLFYRQNYRSLNDLVSDLKSRRVAPKGVAVRIGNSIVNGGLAEWAPRELVFRVMPSVEDVSRYPFYWACRVYVETVRGCSNFRRPVLTSAGERCGDCSTCRSGDLIERIRCPLGVPPGCGYCSVPLVYGYPRSRDTYSIVDEVRKLLDIGVTRIVLSAPDFLDYCREAKAGGILTDPCSPPPNVDAIEKLLQEVTGIEAVVEGRASVLVENVKACLVDEYVAEILGRYLKGTAIYIGLESCSNELLNSIGRPSSCEDTLRAIELLAKSGLKPYVYLMHGLPTEKPRDIAKTVSVIPKIESIGVERIVLYKFVPLPKTAFEKALGYRYRDEAYLEQVELLKKCVREFNEKAKSKILGNILDVVIASEYPKNRRYLVSYPLRHGPVVLLKASKRFLGCIARVRIYGVISDRIVLGTLMHVGYRVANAYKAL